MDILEYLIDAFVTVISFITRTSYIGTNIIMMVSANTRTYKRFIGTKLTDNFLCTDLEYYVPQLVDFRPAAGSDHPVDGPQSEAVDAARIALPHRVRGIPPHFAVLRRPGDQEERITAHQRHDTGRLFRPAQRVRVQSASDQGKLRR